MKLFGLRFVGINLQTGEKVVATVALLLVVVLISRISQTIARLVWRQRQQERIHFWTRQAINLSTAVAGYFVILRGKTFNVGDRIVMGGVRGDVIELGFIQTTIMEMGQPPSVDDADPAMWVRSRQFTGRVVTVSNSKIFSEPVYNYTRDFPYLWEEIEIPIAYTADRDRAEQILLECAARHTVQIRDMSQEALQSMFERYSLQLTDLGPRVYYRITDNWLELRVRFIVHAHGIRDLKDALSRDILRGLDAAGIGIASATYDIVGMPPLRLQRGSGRRGTDGQT